MKQHSVTSMAGRPGSVESRVNKLLTQQIRNCFNANRSIVLRQFDKPMYFTHKVFAFMSLLGSENNNNSNVQNSEEKKTSKTEQQKMNLKQIVRTTTPTAALRDLISIGMWYRISFHLQEIVILGQLLGTRESCSAERSAEGINY